MYKNDTSTPGLKNREYLDQKAKVIMRNRNLIAFTLQQLMSEYKDVDVDDLAQKLSPFGEEGPLMGIDPQSIQDGRLLSECDARFIIPQIGNNPQRILSLEIQSGKSGTGNLVIRMMVNAAHSIAQQKTMLDISDPRDIMPEVDIMVHIVQERRYRNRFFDLAFRLPDGSMDYPGSGYGPRMFHLFLGDADKADDLIIRIYDLVFISDLTEEREKELKRLNIDVPIEYRRGAEFMEYSEKVFREGIEQGIEQGIQIGEKRGEKKGEKRGEKRGLEKGIVRQISKLIADGWSFDEAFDLLAEPGMDREKVRKRVETTDPSSRSP